MGTVLQRSRHLRSCGCLSLLLLGACASVEPPAQPSAPTRADAAPLAPTAPAFVRSEILGRDATALEALLGPAALVRREGEGEFRRYPLAACSLIVILYPNEKGVMAAGHLDAAARVSGEEKPDLDLCLARGPAAPAPAK